MLNNALLITPGCVKISSINHLHEESQILSVKQHNKLLAKQYLTACYLHSHPNHNIAMDDPTPRRIRHDIRTFNTDVIHFIPTIVDLQSGRYSAFYTKRQGQQQWTISATTGLSISILHQFRIMKGSYPGLLEPFWHS